MCLGNEIVQQFKLLGVELSAAKEGHTGEICLRPVEARYAATLHRVLAGDEDDRNCRGGGPRRSYRANVADNHRDLPAHKVGRETRQALKLIIGIPLLDRDIATLDKALI